MTMTTLEIREAARRELDAATRELTGPLSPEELNAALRRWQEALAAIRRLYTAE
jgi:hypothetical protein